MPSTPLHLLGNFMSQDKTIVPEGPEMKWSNYKKYVIGILLVVYTFNFIDRQIIAILSPAIKADLGLNDTQLGLLKGFAFAMFYSLASIPIARLADKKNRVTIISVAVGFWSAMTALCGAATSFLSLLAARIGVGIGEAGCSPPAHSLVSDYFYKEERATALGIYSLGGPFGSLFGILLGGWITATLGWRWAFVAVGLPGVLLAIIVKLTLKEPKRGNTERKAPVEVMADISIIDSLKTMWAIKSFRILMYSAVLTAFSGYGLGMWVVDFLVRTHELSLAQLTVPLALCIGVGGGLGTAAGGALCDKYGRKNKSTYFIFPAIVHIISIPIYVLAILSQSSLLCFAALFFVFVLHASVAGPYYALVQNLSPLKMRAFSAAFFMFMLSAIGFGLGPLYIGVLSDFFAAQSNEALGLQWALLSLTPIWLIASIIMLSGCSNLEEDLA